ncbi:MAG: caspase family protein, partial [Hyphomicrobiaceae bacterium]
IRVYAQPTAYGGRGKIIVHGVGKQAPITKLNVYVANAKGEETQVNAVPAPLPVDADKPPEGGYFQAFEISLFGGENRVRVVAVNAGGDSEPATAMIRHNGEGDLDQRETLWILAIGVNAYPGAKGIIEAATGNALQYRDLRFAGKDAATFAATAARTMGRSHRKVEARLLVGPQIRDEVPGNVKRYRPTRANILTAIGELATKTSPNDTVVVFMAGHGENWSGGRYHFLPTDFSRTDTRIKGRNVIDWADDVMPVFSRIKGRRLLFLDACNAAASRNRTLLGDANASRFTAFQAASSDQKAWEFAQEGHGAFTYVLIQGLKGVAEARDPARRAVTVYSLGPYVKRVVERRTQGAQTPEFAPQGDFVLAR